MSSAPAARDGVLSRAQTILLLAAFACTPREPAVTSPALTLVDSVILQDQDTAYVGKPAAFAVAPDGRLLISDLLSHRVLIFAADGRFLKTVGREGDGPGEFVNPSWLALDGDSILYVANTNRWRIETFDGQTGEPLGGLQLKGPTNTLVARNGILYAGAIDSLSRTTVAMIDRDRGVVRHAGTMPQLYRQNPILANPFGNVALEVFGDTLATAFEVTQWIYLNSLKDGHLLDSAYVPAPVRHGARLDLLNRVTTADPNTAMDALYQSSVPVKLARLPSGRLGLLTVDIIMEHNRFTGTMYLSLVDPQTGTACPDTRVPGPTDPPPRAVVVADTLFVLSQEIEDTEAHTVVKKYLIDETNCDW